MFSTPLQEVFYCVDYAACAVLGRAIVMLALFLSALNRFSGVAQNEYFYDE